MRRPSHFDTHPVLQGSLDGPAPGPVSGDTLVVRGWHLYGDHPVAAVVISFDGLTVALAEPGSELRPDVGEALGDARFEWSGWCAAIDLTGWSGDVLLGVRVLPLGGPPVDLDPVPLHVAGPPVPPPQLLDGALDALSAGADDPLPRRPVNVTGWALVAGSGEPVSRVELVVDGVEVGRARLGIDRRLEAERLLATYAGTSGFEKLVDLGRVVADRTGPAEVEVQARAMTLDGRIGTVTGRMFVEGPAPASDVATAATIVRPAPGPAPTGEDLRLAVFAHSLTLGGGQLWLSELLERCGAGRDFDCTVIGPAHGPLVEQFESLGITVHLNGEAPLEHRQAYEGRAEELARWCDGRGFNAVLANSFGTYLGIDVATRMGLPTVWAIHESWDPSQIWAVGYWWRELDPWIPASVAGAMRSLSAMVFVAEATRRQWESSAAPGRTAVVPYGIDTAAVERYRASVTRAEARDLLGIDPGARVLLAVGTTEARKSQTALTTAFAQVAEEFPDAHLVFLGATWTPYANALRDLVTNLYLWDRVRMVDTVEDVSPWLRAADLLVTASDVESLPRSVLEAMCFGLPVVATSVFGLPELITDGENGYLFEPLDLNATIAALRRVLGADPDEVAAVADAGRRTVLERYDSAGYIHDVLSLLEGLHRDPSRTPAEIMAERPRP